MQKVPTDVVEAIREDRPISDSRLEALRVFTTTVVEKQGWLADEDVAAFLAAGFTKAQILEVILGVSFKTLSNYTNHIADTPLDPAFQAAAWAPVEKRRAS
jgi:alkylhydroperoxidase family enzyme